VIGVGLDPTALDQHRELDRFRQKVEAGRSSPSRSPCSIRRPPASARRGAAPRRSDHRRHLAAGELSNASFMRNEVPGVVVPDAVMERMAAVESREGQLAVASISPASRWPACAIALRHSGQRPFGNIEAACAVIAD